MAENDAPSTESTEKPAAAEADLPSLKAIWKTLGPAGWLAILAATLPGVGGFVVAGYMPTISRALREQGDRGILMYMSVFAVAAGLALLPTWVQSVLGGFAFGVARGVPAALTGFTLASIIGYEVARRASGDRLVGVMKKYPKLRAVREALIADGQSRGFWKTVGVVTLLRLPPNSPFAVTNLVLASVGVPRVAYFIGTVVGMAPRTAAAVMIGNGIAQAMKTTADGAPDFSVPRWLWIVGMVSMVVVLGVLGTVASRAIARVTGTEQEMRPGEEDL